MISNFDYFVSWQFYMTCVLGNISSLIEHFSYLNITLLVMNINPYFHLFIKCFHFFNRLLKWVSFYEVLEWHIDTFLLKHIYIVQLQRKSHHKWEFTYLMSQWLLSNLYLWFLLLIALLFNNLLYIFRKDKKYYCM